MYLSVLLIVDWYLARESEKVPNGAPKEYPVTYILIKQTFRKYLIVVEY
jgi:hypothetical protein